MLRALYEAGWEGVEVLTRAMMTRTMMKGIFWVAKRERLIQRLKRRISRMLHSPPLNVMMFAWPGRLTVSLLQDPG